LHHGVLHLGKRWYVISAELDESGRAQGVRLDGPYPDHDAAEISAKFLGETHGFVLRAGQKYNGLAWDLILSQLLNGLFSTFRRIENAYGYFHGALPTELNSRLGILRKSDPTQKST